MQRVIVITSGKGGVGKTTSAINLGAALNHFGKDVLIIDGNLTTPNIGVILNSPEVPVSLNHILNKKADVYEAVYEHDSGIKIIPSSISLKELKQIKTERLKNYKDHFKAIADYVIVDGAAGLGKESRDVIEMADELIIITNPEIPAITDALKTIRLAEEQGKDILGVLITRVRKDKIELQPETVREMLEVPILGMVPEDLCVKKSLNEKDAVIHTHPKSNASRAYKEIAANMINVKYDSKKDREKTIKRVLRKLGLMP